MNGSLLWGAFEERLIVERISDKTKNGTKSLLRFTDNEGSNDVNFCHCFCHAGIKCSLLGTTVSEWEKATWPHYLEKADATHAPPFLTPPFLGSPPSTPFWSWLGSRNSFPLSWAGQKKKSNVFWAHGCKCDNLQKYNKKVLRMRTLGVLHMDVCKHRIQRPFLKES